jgi:ectoine hydroxylase-related dioxygenase (phytanoyl-CoA dioxygenase family)
MKFKHQKKLLKADGAIFDLYNGKKEFRYLPRPHFVLPSFQKLINSNVLAFSSILLNEDVYFVGIDLHCRAIGSEHPTPPYQDSFLFCFEPGFESFITCYISMTGMDAETAGLRFIKGSHLLPTLEHKKSSIRGFSSIIEENSSLLPDEMLKKEEVMLLDKGECVFFHAKTIHYTNQIIKPRKERVSVSIRIGGNSIKYSSKRQKQYKEFVAFNRSTTLKEKLTKSIPNAQHI